jgi:hypothetical protein
VQFGARPDERRYPHKLVLVVVGTVRPTIHTTPEYSYYVPAGSRNSYEQGSPNIPGNPCYTTHHRVVFVGVQRCMCILVRGRGRELETYQVMISSATMAALHAPASPLGTPIQCSHIQHCPSWNEDVQKSDSRQPRAMPTCIYHAYFYSARRDHSMISPSSGPSSSSGSAGGGAAGAAAGGAAVIGAGAGARDWKDGAAGIPCRVDIIVSGEFDGIGRHGRLGWLAA